MRLDPHPSFLALDRVALGAGDPAVAAHASTCERCRAHLEGREPAPRLPPALRALEAPPWWRRLLALLNPRRAVLAGAAGALAVAALVVALPRAPEAPAVAGTGEPVYLAAKGLATVAVWVKHGDEVRLWDGVAAVAPGDRVQLEIEPGAHRWFVLLAGEGGTRLAEGALEPEHRHLLPRSFVVDDVPGAETLVVVLAPGPLESDRLAAAAAGADPEAKAIRLVIPKERPPGAIR